VDKKPLIKKCLAVGIILLFVGAGAVPSTAKPTHVTAIAVPHSGDFFGLASNIIVSWDANETEEPIIPRGPMRQVQLDISFWVTWGVLGRFINYMYRGTAIRLELSIIDKPEWCSATLLQGTLQCIIPPPKENSHEIVHTQLAVAVAENAPAFELCPVAIQATVEPLHGPFGFLTMMQGTSQFVNVTFTVGYKPLIQLSLPETNIIEAPPEIQVELPIGIANLGNGRTTVVNEVLDYPNDWIVALPSQVILDVGEYKEINLSIIAPSNFSGVETITMGFTPHSSENYSLVGSLTVLNVLAFYNPP
jgi:hypothetical protein